MGPEPTSADYFALRFRTALLLALDEGAPSFEVARSRASVQTFRSSVGLSLDEAERVRCDVARDEAERIGVEPLNSAPFTPGPDYGLRLEKGRREARAQYVQYVTPPAHAVEGEKPRRSGRRR
jgi:hypothetical protein